MRRGLVRLFVLVLVGLGAVWVRRNLVLVNVVGLSMEPTLCDGDRVLVRRCGVSRLRRGDIAILAGPDVAPYGMASPPCPGWHVKRIVALPGAPMPAGVPGADDAGSVPADGVVAFGDNVGADSRHWGPYDAAGVLGRFVCRISKSSGRRDVGPVPGRGELWAICPWAAAGC